MSNIFLSYARRDADWAERLDADLQRAGFRTWRDTRNIDPDQDFSGAIESAIRDASHVVVCLTADVQREDSFVRREIQYALTQDQRRRSEITPRRLPLVPVVFPGGELPVHISTRTAIFLRDGGEYASMLDELLNRLRHPFDADELPTFADNAETVQYLQDLHEWCSQRLRESVAHLIAIEVADTDQVGRAVHTNPFRIGFAVSPSVALRSNGTDTGASPHGNYASLADAFRAYRGRLLLLGGPGAGKTTALLAFARDAAVTRLSNPAAPLPVLASISLWDHHTSLQEWLSNVSPWPSGLSETPMFLLDGLDELGGLRPIDPSKPDDEQYDPRARFLEFLTRDIPNAPVMLTSREQDYATIGRRAPLNGAITLQPLTDAQVREYLVARDQTFLWVRIERDAEFARLIRTPLLLGMLSLAIADEQMLGDADAPLDEAQIFDRYISRRFVHEAAKGHALPFDEHQTRSLLATIAATMWIDSNPGSDDSTLERWALVPQQTSLDIAALRVILTDCADRFVDFCALMHLLRRTASGLVMFQHLKLRDFCALPELFKLAKWVRGGVADPTQCPLGVDLGLAPSELPRWIAAAATQALRIIGDGGVDLIQAARRVGASNNSTLREQRVVLSSSPELFIPDHSRRWVSSTIDVPNVGILVDLSLHLHLDHSWIGDLRVRLRGPKGIVLLLHDRTGGNRKRLATPMTSVLDRQLAGLRGMDCRGKWTVEIMDTVEGDVGVLRSWTLDLRLRR